MTDEEMAEEYYEDVTVGTFQECTENFADAVLTAYKDGAEFGYNKANEWFYAAATVPLPKQFGIYRYTIEVISDKGDMVCYDYKDKNWKKLVIEDEKVTYVPVKVNMWCNKPTKESE